MNFCFLAPFINEPRFKYHVPHEAHALLAEGVGKLLKQLHLNEYEPEWGLGISLIFDKDNSEVAVKGPTTHRKSKEVHFYFWFPLAPFSLVPTGELDFVAYRRKLIAHQKATLVKLFFDALVIMFSKVTLRGKTFSYKEEEIRFIQKEVESQILDKNNEAV